jgi:hypothetical protein
MDVIDDSERVAMTIRWVNSEALPSKKRLPLGYATLGDLDLDNDTVLVTCSSFYLFGQVWGVRS